MMMLAALIARLLGRASRDRWRVRQEAERVLGCVGRGIRRSKVVRVRTGELALRYRRVRQGVGVQMRL